MTAFQAIGWGLVHFLWQGALIALALRVILALAGRARASTRYSIAVAGMTLMPIVVGYTVVSGYDPASAPATKLQATGTSLVAIWPMNQAATRPLPRITQPPSEGGNQAIVDLARSRVKAALPEITWFWLLGVALMGLWHLLGWRTARRLVIRNTAPAPAVWLTTLARLARQLKVSQPVTFLVSTTAQVPAVVGWLKPVIVAPVAALSGLTPIQVELLLAHELAHVKRYDYVVNLVQCFIESLLFYHPAVWWVSARIREEREHCCDDLAISLHGDPITYAEALFAMEQLRLSSPSTPALAASGGSLLHRIRRLLEGSGPSQASSRWAAGLLLAVGATISMASVYWAQSPIRSPQSGSNGVVGRLARDTTEDQTAQPLIERVRAAQHRAKGKRQFWIGYQVVNQAAAYQIDGGDSIGLTGSTLNVILGYSQRDGELHLEEIQTKWGERPETPRGRTVYWVGSTNVDESVALLQTFADETSSPEEKELLNGAMEDHHQGAGLAPFVDASQLAVTVATDSTLMGDVATVIAGLDTVGFDSTSAVFLQGDTVLMGQGQYDLDLPLLITDSVADISPLVAVLGDSSGDFMSFGGLADTTIAIIQQLDQLNGFLSDSAAPQDLAVFAETLGAQDTTISPFVVSADQFGYSVAPAGQADTTDIVAALRALLPKLRSERAKQLTQELINELTRLKISQLQGFRGQGQVQWRGNLPAVYRLQDSTARIRFNRLNAPGSYRLNDSVARIRYNRFAPGTYRLNDSVARIRYRKVPGAYQLQDSAARLQYNRRRYVLVQQDSLRRVQIGLARTVAQLDSINRRNLGLSRVATVRLGNGQTVLVDSTRGARLVRGGGYGRVIRSDSTGRARVVLDSLGRARSAVTVRSLRWDTTAARNLRVRVDSLARSRNAVVVGQVGAARAGSVAPDTLLVIALWPGHDPEVQKAAVNALVESGPRGSLTEIARIARTSSNSSNRAQAILTYGHRASAGDAVRLLSDLIKTEKSVVCQRAILSTLAGLGDEGVEALVNITKHHQNRAVRKLAISYWAEIDDEAAAQELNQLPR